MLMSEEVGRMLKKFRCLQKTLYMEDPGDALTVISLLSDTCTERYISVTLRMVLNAKHMILISFKDLKWLIKLEYQQYQGYYGNHQ